ncbi:hypothetical protein GCM10029964_122750 [Kibdelosporangium lantanae]
MRKTISRGVLLTATAGFALLGFGLGQANALVPALPPLQATPNVPALPTLPASLTALPTLPDTSFLTGVGNSRSSLPATPELPSVPSLPSAKEVPGLGGLAGLPSVVDLLPQQDAVAGLTSLDTVPDLDDQALPTEDLPTDELGLPSAESGALPVGLDPRQLPQLPKLPAEASAITKAPVVQLPETHRLPVVAQVDHNDITHKILPNTNGVDVQGLPKPEVPDLTSALGAVKLPTSTPQTPGMQSLGLPAQLPVVSDVDTTMPSLDDVTGGATLPTQLPALPAV